MPAALSLELFLQAGSDPEAARYRILATFREHERALQQRRLFPTWRDIQQLRATLQELLRQRLLLEQAFPHVLLGIDWDALQLVAIPAYTPQERERALQQLFLLIEWALPLVEELHQHSQELYDFACEHIAVHEVGLLWLQRREGFLLTPDRAQQRVFVWHYRVRPVVGANERPLVQLAPVMELPMGTIWAPDVWRSAIQHRVPAHPAPTYICDADEDFPLQETLLPIAEEKLAQRVGNA